MQTLYPDSILLRIVYIRARGRKTHSPAAPIFCRPATAPSLLSRIKGSLGTENTFGEFDSSSTCHENPTSQVGHYWTYVCGFYSRKYEKEAGGERRKVTTVRPSSNDVFYGVRGVSGFRMGFRLFSGTEKKFAKKDVVNGSPCLLTFTISNMQYADLQG
jgi:hypothetical protein